jgi:D-proline reductase (dithiol) PrdB
MTRLEDIPQPLRNNIAELPCPSFSDQPFVGGPPLAERRVALVSTAGLHIKEEPPFTLGSTEFRRIPSDADSGDIRMSHISVNFDRTGFYRDLNVIFPLERLREMERDGTIGSSTDNHFSFMGATDPERLKYSARELAVELRKQSVNAALLVPV